MRYKTALSALLALSLSAAPALAYDAAAPGREQLLSGGAAESFAIDGGGTLWAWGDNAFGQLGNGTVQGVLAPIPVMEGIRSVSAGESHTYAVREDNTLWAWGRDMSDSFAGLSSEGYSAAPIKLMDDVASASTGVCTHLAVKTDGSLWAWGRYVGNRTNKQCAGPQKILDRVAAAATGFGHSLAIKRDGSLWAWGQNADGEIGDGTTRERLTPVKVMEDVVQASAGYGFSAAVKADGTLWTWGRNWQGELGDGSTQSRSTPAQIMDHVVSVHASNNNMYALREDGTVWGWGHNGSGEVGDSSTAGRLSPVLVMGDVAALAAGWDHVLALKTDGSLWAWGGNLMGQLGVGDSGFVQYFQAKFRAAPVQVMDRVTTPEDAAPSALSTWAAVPVSRAVEAGFVPETLREEYSHPITRAEFCALAVQFYERCTGAEVEGRVSFSDTDDPNVEKAAYLGIASGTGDGSFHPGAPLDREQAALILSNLARALDRPLPQSVATFHDRDEIGGWALQAVGQVQGAGIMSGVGGGRFAPGASYTREQSIATVMGLYDFLQQK